MFLVEESGHQEYNFPLLVPEDLLEKENQLVSRLKAARELGVDPSELRMDEEDSGFKKEVYWVTNMDLDEDLKYTLDKVLGSSDNY